MKYLIAICMSVLFVSNANAYCSKSGEQQSGMNKICYYKCVSGTKAITIGSTELCPLSIDGYMPSISESNFKSYDDAQASAKHLNSNLSFALSSVLQES